MIYDHAGIPIPFITVKGHNCISLGWCCYSHFFGIYGAWSEAPDGAPGSTRTPKRRRDCYWDRWERHTVIGERCRWRIHDLILIHINLVYDILSVLHIDQEHLWTYIEYIPEIHLAADFCTFWWLGTWPRFRKTVINPLTTSIWRGFFRCPQL